jgi:hypothetical protein
MGTEWEWNAETEKWEWQTFWPNPWRSVASFLAHGFSGPQYTPGASRAATGVTGIGTGGFGAGVGVFHGSANELNPTEVVAAVGEQGRAGVQRAKLSAAIGANIGAPVLLIPASIGVIDAGLHGEDALNAYANSTLVGAVCMPASFTQGGRIVLVTVGTPLGLYGAKQSLDEGNVAGGLFRFGTTAFGVAVSRPDIDAVLNPNLPRLNPFNYQVQSEGMGMNFGNLRVRYVNPKQAAIEGAIEAEGLSVVSPPSTRLGSPGRLGNAATRQQIQSIAEMFKRMGWEVVGGADGLPEFYIQGAGGGTRGSVYVDLVVRDPATGQRVFINTIDRPGSARYALEMWAIQRAAEQGVRIVPVLKPSGTGGTQ